MEKFGIFNLLSALAGAAAEEAKVPAPKGGEPRESPAAGAQGAGTGGAGAGRGDDARAAARRESAGALLERHAAISRRIKKG